MLFSSIPFLYYFLPCVLICYVLAPKCLKNVVLLVFSLLFYAWGEPRHIFPMLAAILMGYLTGLLLEKTQNQSISRLIFWLSIGMIAGMLIYYKYSGFLGEIFTGLFSISSKQILPQWLTSFFAQNQVLPQWLTSFFAQNQVLPQWLTSFFAQKALPIGISFYTFQLLSYLIDVYRKEVPAQKNPISLAAYIALFPQLIAGPIVRYSQIAEELSDRIHTTDQIASGIRRFILGLSKKILFSNTLGELCEIFRASPDKSVLFYWIYAVAFMLHIYFDFSGYSDMAIGLGRIFGFHFPENFNYPYISSSITEFWRRWHISLGSWFRDYIYIPLGGNRVSKQRWFRNILIVWLLTGLWHGAAWNFLIWGLYFAVLLIIEKQWKQSKSQRQEKTQNPWKSQQQEKTQNPWKSQQQEKTQNPWKSQQQEKIQNPWKLQKQETIQNPWKLQKQETIQQQKQLVQRSNILKQLLRHLLVLFFICISFVIFNASSLSELKTDLLCLFGLGGVAKTSTAAVYYLKSYFFIGILSIVGATPLPKKLLLRLQQTAKGEILFAIFEPLVLILLLLTNTAYLVDGSFQPFLYFRF